MNELSPTPPNPSDHDVRRRTSHNGVRLPWPTDWTALFGRNAPLFVEIGFGGGHFLVDLAKHNPDANVVGVEISHHCLHEAERKMVGLGLRNLHLIHLDAVATLAYICAPTSIDKLYINFPDPFPKTAHVQRRLLAPYSLALIASRLKPGALLTIATDVPAYAESIAADLAATVAFIAARTHRDPL
jgi:tRNA (guanine-N7-)-methyltransferase